MADGVEQKDFPNRDHSAQGDPPTYRPSRPDPSAGDVLSGSEAGATVATPGGPEARTTTGQSGDLVDGDEGSATGSRTEGQTTPA
jgi:hypothetical protein